MGTIIPRKRSNGTTGYTAQIVIKRNGKRVHSEAQTFEREQAAITWMGRRERELNSPGGLEPKPEDNTATLADVIDKFLDASAKKISATKRGILRETKTHAIARKECRLIVSADIVKFATDLSRTRAPATVMSYLVHIGSVFALAKPAWGYPLDQQALRDAIAAAKRLGIAAAAVSRDRRPTLTELDMIMTRLKRIYDRKPSSAPMHVITAFAIFSCRRQDEIARMLWADLDEPGSRVLIRDMKDPVNKIGNHMWCNLTDEALRIIQAQPRDGELIFPYTATSVSHAFWKACRDLKIEDLRFHDLRHEGVSRLFEMEKTIPQVADVSGHRSWSSLKRYTHVRQIGDKYKDWKWLEVVTQPQPLGTPQP